MIPAHLHAQIRELAKRRFQQEVIAKLRAKRLGAAVKPPAAHEPDGDELGGFDALQQMYDAKKPEE